MRNEAKALAVLLGQARHRGESDPQLVLAADLLGWVIRAAGCGGGVLAREDLVVEAPSGAAHGVKAGSADEPNENVPRILRQGPVAPRSQEGLLDSIPGQVLRSEHGPCCGVHRREVWGDGLFKQDLLKRC